MHFCIMNRTLQRGEGEKNRRELESDVWGRPEFKLTHSQRHTQPQCALSLTSSRLMHSEVAIWSE